MSRVKINTINFFIDFFSKRSIPVLYSRVCHENNKEILNYENPLFNQEIANSIYAVSLIPGYLQLVKSPDLKCKNISQNNKGFAVDLENFTNIETYIKYQFRSNATAIRSRLNRLEVCFDVHYKMFDEQITHEEYTFLMGHLHGMLKRRFKQREEQNINLQKWDELQENVMSYIKEKRAKLFVIFDAEKPIQITLLYNFGKILFASIPSYDIDYQKFGLGNTAIYKQLEWCLANDYAIFEMGHGDLDYKRRWSNLIYNYEQQILYKENSIGIKLMSYFLSQFYVLKEFLKKREVDIIYKKWVSLLTKNKKITGLYKRRPYEVENLKEISMEADKAIIDINTDVYAFLRKPTYDFQYLYFEHAKNIKVYRLFDEQDSYIIAGKNNLQNITIT